MKVYAISGLGADSRVFNYLELDCDLVPLKWIDPEDGESLEAYAKRLAASIDTSSAYALLGVSFGGLVATEISKILAPQCTFLISSVRTKKELPPLVRLLGKLGLIPLIPSFLFRPPRFLNHYFFDTENKVLLDNIINDTDLQFAKWAIQELTSWKNESTVPNLIRIHGTKDRLLPLINPENTHLIDGGTHFMVVDRAKEISQLIKEELKNYE